MIYVNDPARRGANVSALGGHPSLHFGRRLTEPLQNGSGLEPPGFLFKSTSLDRSLLMPIETIVAVGAIVAVFLSFAALLTFADMTSGGN